MDLIIIILLSVLVLGLVYFIWKQDRKKLQVVQSDKKSEPRSNILILQGYERMITFSERIGFKKLTERLSSEILGADEQASVYIEAIRNEYEFNLSQQIYISDKSWQMVTDFKDQQIFIIGQLRNAIPQHARGIDLANAMMEFLKVDEKASLQSIVLETLRFEARQQI